MAQENNDPRFEKHQVSGKDIEDFCSDVVWDKNYYCRMIEDDYMRFQKQKPPCSDCPLYLFKLHIMGVDKELCPNLN